MYDYSSTYKYIRQTMESKQELDWKSLGFGYHPTDYNLKCYYRDGQ